MAHASITPIPSWLEEHCFRLQDEGANVQNLNLNLRRLTNRMMQALTEALLKSQRIEIINLTSALSGHDPNHVILPFIPVLNGHPSLRIIYLSYNRLQAASAIGATLRRNTTLLELYLDYNQLNTATAIALAYGLEKNQTLRVLQLNSNKIGDAGGKALALALRDNTCLKSLGMNRNQLGMSTGAAFLSVLEDNLSLTTIHIEENPDLVPLAPIVKYMVRTNKAGRYLLKDNTGKFQSIWPLLLRRLDPDMMYFFLKENPDSIIPTRDGD